MPTLVDEATRARLQALAPHITPKPWGQFFSAASFEKPLQLDSVTARAMTNVKQYSHNYGILSGFCVLFALLTSPVTATFALVGALAGAAYRLDYRGLAARVDAKVAYGGLAFYALLLASCTSVLQIVLMGLACAGIVCGLHAATHEAPESFT